METETESYEDVDEIIKEITSVQKSSHFDPNSFQLPPKTHTERMSPSGTCLDKSPS